MAALAPFDPSHRLRLVEGAIAGAYPVSRADAATKIRLIIASPVHLMRTGYGLRGRDGVLVTETVI